MGSAEGSHPGHYDLERFMSGRMDRLEARAVVRHLLAGCPQCVRVTRQLWLLGDRAPGGPQPPHDRAAHRGTLRLVGLKG